MKVDRRGTARRLLEVVLQNPENTIDGLARRTGLSPVALSRILGGKMEVSAGEWEKIKNIPLGNIVKTDGAGRILKT